VLYPTWDICVASQSLPSILFILTVITLVEDDITVILISENMRGNAIEKPPIVRNHHGRSRECLNGIFEGAECFDVKIVSRFIE
jgi:hypothetical protein